MYTTWLFSKIWNDMKAIYNFSILLFNKKWKVKCVKQKVVMKDACPNRTGFHKGDKLYSWSRHSSLHLMVNPTNLILKCSLRNVMASCSLSFIHWLQLWNICIALITTDALYIILDRHLSFVHTSNNFFTLLLKLEETDFVQI